MDTAAYIQAACFIFYAGILTQVVRGHESRLNKHSEELKEQSKVTQTLETKVELLRQKEGMTA